MRSDTKKSASTKTLAAITGRFEVLFLACAEVCGQLVHRADEIGNAFP